VHCDFPYVADSMADSQSSQISPVFTSVPMNCAMLLVRMFQILKPDTVDFARKTALSWAQSVRTVEDIVMHVVSGSGMLSSNQEDYAYEVARSEDGVVELRPTVTSDEVDEIKDRYNMWH
jgi:hypothetical protein